MKYRCEALVSGKIVYAESRIATHPRQVLEYTFHIVPNATRLNLMNEKGEVWVILKKTATDFQRTRINYRTLNQDEVLLVFRGEPIFSSTILGANPQEEQL